MSSGFRILLVAAAFLAGIWSAWAAPSPAARENWAYTYPDAAFELWSWAREYPAAARRFSRWEARNRDRSGQLVAWAIAYPGRDLGRFLESHPDWPDLGQVAERHAAAARGLLAWCRHYPGAARALLKTSRAGRARAAAP
ncbi:hypothetical protein FO488_04955 [Geobacter sp. FeAm09]|nr:hypothetical protein FO488_04955 [Geobacter sp. FeAm09]